MMRSWVVEYFANYPGGDIRDGVMYGKGKLVVETESIVKAIELVEKKVHVLFGKDSNVYIIKAVEEQFDKE